MNTPSLIRRLGLVAAACTVPVVAQTSTVWDGDTDSSFNNAANWSNGLPSATNAVVFDSTSTANLTNIAVQPAITTLGITVTDPGSNVGITIGSSGTLPVLTVGAGGITLSGTRDLTITRGTSTSLLFLTPSATQDWNISTGRNLGLSTTGEYDLGASGVAVTMKGGGAVSITATTFDIGQAVSNSVIVDGAALTTTGNIRLGQTTSTVNGVGNLTIKSGTATVGGVLQFGSAGGASGNLVVEGGSTLSLRKIQSVAGAGASTATFDGANLTATLADAILIDSSLGSFTTSVGDGGLNVNTNSLNVSINAVMGNKSGEVGVLTKSGLGTLTLTAGNTFTGLTTVAAGTLALNTTGTLASTAYTVANGATFDVSAKSAYNLSGVALTIGAGAGTNGVFNAGTADLTFGGSLTVNLTTLTPDASYDLLNFGSQPADFSSVALTGAFSGGLSLTSTDTWTGNIGGYAWTFDEATGVLSSSSVIPEPSSFAALAGLAGLGCAGLRRRRA